MRHHRRGRIEEALLATRALGDDTIDGLEPGTVVLDAFSHGTGEATQLLVQARAGLRKNSGMQYLLSASRA